MTPRDPSAAAEPPELPDLLSLTTHLPEHHFETGEMIVQEGGRDAAIWVLVRGMLQVRKNGVPVNTITQPGAVVGEISVLLGLPYGATVSAAAPCVMRRAADGPALLALHPQVTRLIAVGLAERLNFVTAYLADLRQQYGQAPGIAMVTDVLHQLAAAPRPSARPGSAREPDPEY